MVDKPTIFVVDDDDAVRDSLTALIEAAGFAAQAYPSAEAFLDAGQPERGACLVTDVRMPGMSGLALHEQLAARGAGLAVIVMTGHGDVAMAVRAMKAGAVDFLEKPFAPEALIESVRRALALGRARQDAGTQSAEARARILRLTPREREVLQHLVAGRPNKVIAHQMRISPRTVEIHRAKVMDKMEARSLSELVRLALAGGVGI